jgi:flagellin-specific chaperone FliS
MNPHLKYKTAQSWSWTRVDMLLLVYEQAVSSLNEGARLLEQNKLREFPAVQFRAMRALLAIADGLDLQKGDLPINILQLVVFSLDRVKAREASEWRDAARLMNTVREGFMEIQDEARKAEYEGRVPALDSIR